MSGIFLTSCTNFFLIRWIANILGFIMNLFYIVIDKFGIGKISICIIVFTIIVKLVMLPINIKQQKTMKLNSVIMPEIQAIQKKYANKKDNDSMMKQQAELNAVYQKYGTSPTGGCLPMLIQFPILLALYAVMACLPNYINEIQDMLVRRAIMRMRKSRMLFITVLLQHTAMYLESRMHGRSWKHHLMKQLKMHRI